MLLLPVFLCILMLFQIRNLNTQLDTLTKEVDLLRGRGADTSGNGGDERSEADPKSRLSDTAEKPGKTDDGEKAGKEAGETADAQTESGKIRVYLTFDDGPSPSTDDILDVLAEYDVKATFFVTGKEGEYYEKLYKRIADEGHTLGMHSYSHKYNEIYASKQAFEEDLEKLQDYLYEVTGVWSRFYRFPGGSSNNVSKVPMQDLVDDLAAADIYYLDWNIESGDASGQALSARAIADRVLSKIGAEQTQVVLFHDAADKRSTVEALSIILKSLSGRDDVEILPVSEDMDLTPAEHLKIGGEE